MSGEADFLYANKHESFLQIDATGKVPKIASLQCLYNISNTKLVMKLIFCMQINISTSWHYRFWWKWPDIPKDPKVFLLPFKTLRYFSRVLSCSFLLVSSNYLLRISIGDFCIFQDYWKSNIQIINHGGLYIKRKFWTPHLKILSYDPATTVFMLYSAKF